MTFEMQARQRGGARKQFVETTGKVIAEYLGGWLGATAAMAEIVAAKRAMDRQMPVVRREGRQNGR